MDKERHAEVGEDGKRLRELVRLHMGKLFDAGVAQKALEREHAFGLEGGELMHVAADEAAGETHIHVELALGGAALGLEPGAGGRGRQTIERHVHEGGDAPRRRGSRRGGEAFPLGAARLIDVHVGVHDAGHDRVGSDVGHRRTLGTVAVVADLCDAAAGDVDRVRARPRGGHYARARQDPRAHCVCAP